MPVNKHFYLDENGLGQYDTLLKQYIPHSSLPAASGGTDLSLVTTGEKAEWQDKGNYVIRGTNTTSNTFGHWTGNIPIPELYNGLTITYCCSRSTKEVSSCDLELTFPDGSTSGRVEVLFDDGVNVSTEYQRNRCLTLTYFDADHTYWGEPGWIVITPSVLQWYVDDTEDGNYPLLFSEYAGRVTVNTTNCGAFKDTTFWYNPSTRNLHAEKVNGYTLASACEKQVDTEVTSGSSNLVTSGAVYTAIDNLPEPMVFKGTLGTGGTITTLPTASSSNEGYTYKVITAGTYASQSAKVGDVFVSNGSAWVLIPSGDTDTDTWRNIKVNGTELLGSAISTGAINFKSGTNTTVSGSGNDITISSTDTNTTYSLTQNASDGHKITLTPSSGTAQTITIPDNNTTYSMTRDGANVKLTPSSGSAQSVGLSELINGLGEGTSPAQGADYLVAQYAGGGTSTTSYHRRSVSNVVNSTVVKAALGTGSGTTKYLREDGTWVQPPNTNTTYTFANGTNGFTVTPSGGSAQTVTVTPSITNNVTGSGTSGYLAKFNGAHTITNGVALGSSTTTFLRNDGTWATPPGGTDTKNTAGSTNNTGKLFLVGALEQSANPQTYSNSGVSVKGNGELSSHTWSVKNSNDYSRAECYVDAEDRGRINVYDENGIGRIKLIGNSGVTLNDSSDTTTIFLDSEEGRVECEKMSYTNGTVTFSKSSGSWTFRDGEYTRSGQVVQIRISFKGGGSNVSVGSNAIAGTINGIPTPPYTVRLQGYYSGTVLMGELTDTGGFNVRILGQALNLSSSNAATLSGTYIVED